MKKLVTSTFILVAAFGFGYVKDVSAAAPINKIVNPGFLGVTVKYAEFMIGSPAMREKIDDLGFQRNTYERGDCYIDVGIKNDKVVSVGMYFEPKKGCDVDVSNIVNRQGVSMDSMTRFKDYAWRGELHFTSPQFPSCNACGEGPFYATIDGTGAMGYLSVQLTGDAYGSGSQYDAWMSLLERNGVEGHSLPLTAENCPLRRFDAQAFNLLKNTRVTGIAFSSSLNRALQPECSGKTVWSLNLRG